MMKTLIVFLAIVAFAAATGYNYFNSDENNDGVKDRLDLNRDGKVDGYGYGHGYGYGGYGRGYGGYGHGYGAYGRGYGGYGHGYGYGPY